MRRAVEGWFVRSESSHRAGFCEVRMAVSSKTLSIFENEGWWASGVRLSLMQEGASAQISGCSQTSLTGLILDLSAKAPGRPVSSGVGRPAARPSADPVVYQHHPFKPKFDGP